MPIQQKPRRALVIGGSVGGLIAGLLLRRQGWDVVICERSATPLSGRGAGIVTHAQLWDILEAAGVSPDRQDGVTVQQRITLDAAGEVIGRHAYPQIMTSWDQLFGLLRHLWGEADYHLGQELCGLDPMPDGVRAHFTGADSKTADLLVAADGFRSGVRDLCLGPSPLLYAGYVGWRGMVDEAVIPRPSHRDLFGVFAFCLPAGEQFIGYPVAGDGNDLRPGRRRYNFVWYRPADAAGSLPGLLTDTTGHSHTMSIPPPLIRPELIAALRADAVRTLAPQIAAIVRATPAPFLQPIYDFEAPRISFGHVALLGDAAFVARPHVGAGVTKAAGDALALATALQTCATVPEALAQYQAARLPEGQRIVRRARHLGAYMQAHLATDEERAAAQRHHSPEAVMAESASMDF